MATYFDQIKSFKDVPVTDSGVDTLAFLEAAEGLVSVFDLFESVTFPIVKNDMNGNITKVKNRYDAAPTLSDTLEKLVINESAEEKTTATEGLMWLLRGLNFTKIAFQNSKADEKEELSVSFDKSYEATLKKYHGILGRPAFWLAMKDCPYRNDFYTKLGPKEKVDAEFDPWLNSLDITSLPSIPSQHRSENDSKRYN